MRKELFMTAGSVIALLAAGCLKTHPDSIITLPNGPGVEVTGNSTAGKAKIQQWSWFPNNGQKWKLIRTDSAYYNLVNVTSNKCLKSPSATSGDILQQVTDHKSLTIATRQAFGR